MPVTELRFMVADVKSAAASVFSSSIAPAEVTAMLSPEAVTLSTFMLPEVVVDKLMSRPVPLAVTVVKSRLPDWAFSVIDPSFVVADVTAKPPAVSDTFIAPVPETEALVKVVAFISS